MQWRQNTHHLDSWTLTSERVAYYKLRHSSSLALVWNNTFGKKKKMLKNEHSFFFLFFFTMSVACHVVLKYIKYAEYFTSAVSLDRSVRLCWGRRAEGRIRYKHTERYLRHVLIRDQYLRGSGQICWPFQHYLQHSTTVK